MGSGRVCTRCSRHYPFSGKYFPRSEKTKTGLGSTCLRCLSGPALARKPNPADNAVGVPPRRQKICGLCCGLPHARPRDRLCDCKGAYQPEGAITVAKVHEWPVENRRIA